MSKLDPDVEATLQSVNEWLQRRQARDAAILQSVKTWLQNREDTLKTKDYLVRMGFAKEDVDRMRLSTEDEQIRASKFLICAMLAKFHSVRVLAYKKLTVMLSFLSVFGASVNMGPVSGNTEMVLKKLLNEIKVNNQIFRKLSRLAQGNMIFVEKEPDFGFLRIDSQGLISSLLVNVLDPEMLEKALKSKKQIYLYKPSYVDLDVAEINDIKEVVKGANALLVETELETLVEFILSLFKTRCERENPSGRSGSEEQ